MVMTRRNEILARNIADTFCLPCLAQWIRDRNAEGIPPSCPTCKHPLGTDPGALRVNTDIANAMGLMNAAQTPLALVFQRTAAAIDRAHFRAFAEYARLNSMLSTAIRTAIDRVSNAIRSAIDRASNAIRTAIDRASNAMLRIYDTVSLRAGAVRDTVIARTLHVYRAILACATRVNCVSPARPIAARVSVRNGRDRRMVQPARVSRRRCRLLRYPGALVALGIVGFAAVLWMLLGSAYVADFLAYPQKEPEVMKAVHNRAADVGPTTLFDLGMQYYEGWGGSPKNYDKAVLWFRRAAEAGHMLAQFNLGVCYDEGIGVALDQRQSLAWFLRAAEAGYAEAQSAVGRHYFNGEGVRQDKQRALMWYRRAADAGHVRALLKLAVCYETGDGVAVDEKRSLALYKQVELAAAAGSVEAISAILKVNAFGSRSDSESDF